MAQGGLAEFLGQLRATREQQLELEPEIDDSTLKDIKGLEDAATVKEKEDLAAGAVLKGTVEPGQGEESPVEGDLVFLHYAIRNAAGEVLASTFPGQGGAGRPAPFQLGKGARMLRGMELAVLDMKKGERAVINIKPAYAFKHPASGLPLPAGLRRDEPVTVEAVLTNWYPARGVRAVGEAGDVFRRLLKPAEGWEAPRQPFEVTFHITMRVPGTDGRQGQGEAYFSTQGATGEAAFASSGGGSGEGQPITAALGSGMLPPAVDAALCSMVRGDEAVVACRAQALRGGSALPDPPAPASASGSGSGSGGGGGGGGGEGQPDPGAWLEFSVQLLDFLQVRDLTGDGQVVKRIVQKGEGEFPIDCPLEDSSVRVHYRVRQAAGASSGAPASTAAAEWAWDSREAGGGEPVPFDTGMGSVPDALDMAVRLMLRGETSLVRAAPRYAYGSSTLSGAAQQPPLGIDPEQPVEFELTLLEFEGEPNHAGLSNAERLARARRWKEQGNELYKQGKYQLARAKYQKSLKWANQATAHESQAEEDQAVATRLAAHLNLAACAQKEEAYGEAIGWCNKAIEIDPEHAKAYFRRAAALVGLSEWDAARDDLAITAYLDPAAKDDCEREEKRIAALERRAEEKTRRDLRSFLDR